MTRSLACFLAAAAVACSGTDHTTTFPPTPERSTSAQLAGHRCQGVACTCRGQASEDAEEKAPPAEGMKRYEWVVGTTTGTAWVSVDKKDVLYKNEERAEDCFYTDLPAGQHTVAIRAKAGKEGGVGVAVHIREYGPKGPYWYDSFKFECGAPGPCTREQLESWKKEVDTNRKSLRDPCGSTRIRSLQWETGRMPDALHPEEVMLNCILNVPPYDPKQPPGTEDCPEN